MLREARNARNISAGVFLVSRNMSHSYRNFNTKIKRQISAAMIKHRQKSIPVAFDRLALGVMEPLGLGKRKPGAGGGKALAHSIKPSHGIRISYAFKCRLKVLTLRRPTYLPTCLPACSL